MPVLPEESAMWIEHFNRRLLEIAYDCGRKRKLATGGQRMAGNQYDVVVIGTGPGGEGAAMQAVKHGRRVAVVERFPKIGGGCTYWGTIPSKALRFAIFQMLEVNSNRLFREAGIKVELEFPQLLRGASSVVQKQEE